MFRFADVYSELDMTSVEARKLYDEDFDKGISTLAGNGRTLYEARQIWDQFRFGYHTYSAVKAAFQRVYGLDPDDDTDLGGFLNFGSEASAADFRRFESAQTEQEIADARAFLREKNSQIFKKYGVSAEDEFTTVFGDKFFESKTPSGSPGVPGSNAPSLNGEMLKVGIEKARQDFIDAGAEDSGLINYFNELAMEKIQGLRELISSSLVETKQVKDNSEAESYLNRNNQCKTIVSVFSRCF